MKHYKLLIPGPVDAEDAVLAQMAKPILPHYGTEWVELYHQTINYLKQVFQTENDLFLLVGPGTAALDMAFGSLLAPGEKALILSNGFFGDRLVSIARACGIETTVLSSPLGQIIDPQRLRAYLRSDSDIRALALVHHETSTGVLNPLAEIAAVARERGVPIILDAVSSLGGVPLPVDEWGIDLCITVANKCLAAPPGLAPISVSPRAWEIIDRNTATHGWYLNLKTWRKYADMWAGFHPYPTTLPTNNILALRASLRCILDSELETWYARHRKAADRVRRGLEELGFEMFAPDEHASPLTTAVKAHPEFEVGDLIQFLKEKHGLLVSGGIAELAGKIFRVGHMGKAASREYTDALLGGVADFIQHRDLF